MKRNYVQVCKLNTLWADDARWQRNVENTGVGEDYALWVKDDWEYTVQELDDSKLVEDGGTLYGFAGSKDEEERFYALDAQVYAAEDGTYWVEERDEVYEW